MVDSGKRDDKGHVILIPVPVKNTLGEEVEVTEYIIPPSMHELCAFLHIDRATWSRYMGESEEFAAVGERVRERMKAWNEHEMLTRPGKDLKGILFNLTNNYGYSEKKEVELGERATKTVTAATNMIGPLAITVAVSAGLSPIPVAVGIALSASLGFMLPVSTPPNAIVYATGYIPITKMLSTGVYIDIIGIGCVTIPLSIYFVTWVLG